MESVTIKDIARMCGVGVSTVSRAINNHPDINQETKEMIMRTIAEHNYVPNNSARNLKRTDARTIAVLVKGISNPLFNRMIKIFEAETQKEKYSLVLQHVDDWQDEVDVAIQLEKEKRLRGIVFLGGYFSHSEDKLRQISVPFVLSTIGLLEDENKKKYASVSVDDVKESGKIVDYLISKGHEKIAILASTEDDESIGRLRLEGYYQALKKHGIAANPSLVKYMNQEIGSYTMENGYEMAKELLESGEEFTAIYAISDQMAVGACKAIFESGKSVPEDYSVTGFDGLDIAQFYNPSITTLRQPMEEMAEATIRTLLELIRKKSKNRHIVFDGELVEAQSVREI
ncbi:MAG: LacI family DNA-binding transcriptional regulator [Marvinbryantia sp.]|uniref:LacI family DNA-binding transcriptional regulator n=1 Tax=Marvinbryantia sp. TaxID=2496532 RepID=UPI0025E0B6C5|nr:LacI family DNA-binding transcriptional regulator [uncultured Marvinbryantia sp.]